MRINGLYIALGLVNSMSASPFNATLSTTIGCWRPLESQIVLDLEIVYGKDVMDSFRSWNPRVINVDHIFPNVTYNVSYYKPLAAAAIAASISWSPSFTAPFTTTMLLKVPGFPRTVHRADQLTAIPPGIISSSIGTSTKTLTLSSAPSTTPNTAFNSKSGQSPNSAPSSTQKHESSVSWSSSTLNPTSVLTSTLSSVPPPALTSTATSTTTPITTSTTTSTTTPITTSTTASTKISSSTSAPTPPAQNRNECHGVSGPYWVVSRDVAVDTAKTFCDQEEKVVTYNIDSVNQLELSVSKTDDDVKNPRDDPSCLNRIRDYIIDGCDGNDSKQNPFNYKFGSKLTSSDGWVYEMKPLDKKVNEVSCDVSSKFLCKEAEIRGKNVPYAKMGVNGEGLKKQLKGCGVVSFWDFHYTPDDAKFHWYAKAQLPALVGMSECVGKALRAAGGADRGHCR